jgi:tRNA threonylcarbamoyladenosine biosynthesis protein TsaB
MRAPSFNAAAMSILLALDTSTEACSVALFCGQSLCGQSFDGQLLDAQVLGGQTFDEQIDERYIEAPREHMLRLLPMVDELLAARQLTPRDLDGIVFTRGPGSFTGLRITLGVVQGLAFGADLPVLPVSTLAALAQTAATPELAGSFIFSAIDARMDEVYCAWFEVGTDGLVVARSEERVCAPEAVPVIEASKICYGVGSGWNYAARLPIVNCRSVDAAALPRASSALRLALPRWQAGERVPVAEALPVYLRNDVAWAKSATDKK